jgi:hypothetical protein
MSAWRIAGSMSLLAAVSIGAARAQSPDLEPRVQTSAPAPAPAAMPAPVAMPAPASVPASAAKVPPTASKPGTGATAAAVPQAGATSSKSQDRIQLDTTQISGNRELPKVMYVVPWRKPDLGDFAGKPPNSLLDEALTPVDRDVFRRQNRYYSALGAGTADARSQPGAAGAPGGGAESKVEK